MSDALKNIEQKLDLLLDMQVRQEANISALYRRTTALAYMIEALNKEGESQMPAVIRAEIDASVDPESFSHLFEQDPQEFANRYGEGVLQIIRAYGVQAVSTMGELTQKQERVMN